MTIAEWILDLSSRSYVIAIALTERHTLLAEIEGVLEATFPDGAMSIPYQTRVLMAGRQRP
ncbi:MAG TPA: hypothetical protein VMO88_01380 [Acidimicrobiales bacterium]|nr:hypothetical protein [Acidimicrobiales bacterium]